MQKKASIQKRTSPLKFDHLAAKSEKDSISNLSTKATSSVEKLGDEAGEEALGSGAALAELAEVGASFWDAKLFQGNCELRMYESRKESYASVGR